MKKFVYSGADVRLCKAVEKYAADVSYNALNKLLRDKDVKINGVRVGKDCVVKDGDEVVLYNRAIGVKSVFVDDNVLVAFKPKGIASEGVGGFEDVVRAVYPTARLCHRLDTNTDGLLIFSLNDKAYDSLLDAFRQKQIEKRYKALVYGKLYGEGTLSGYLIKNSDEGVVTVVDKPQKGAVYIETSYKVIDTYIESSLVDIYPVTGKTHQIRAHFASIGHFVLGDGKYGRDDLNKKFGFKKQQLTAYKLIFHLSDKNPLSYLNTACICLEDKNL